MPAEVTGAVSFYIELDSITEGFFKEVSGGDIEMEVIEHRGSGKTGEQVMYKIPGNAKYSNIVLRRGVTDDTKLHDWFQKVLDKGAGNNRKNGSLTGYDKAQQEVYKINFVNAWPCKAKGMVVDASKNEYTLEEFELCVERITRTK